MKTAISIPDRVFDRVEEHAHRLGMSRSEFFTRAADRWADELDKENITAAIDAALALAGPAGNEEFMTQAAERALMGSDPSLGTAVDPAR